MANDPQDEAVNPAPLETAFNECVEDLISSVGDTFKESLREVARTMFFCGAQATINVEIDAMRADGIKRDGHLPPFVVCEGGAQCRLDRRLPFADVPIHIGVNHIIGKKIEKRLNVAFGVSHFVGAVIRLHRSRRRSDFRSLRRERFAVS